MGRAPRERRGVARGRAGAVRPADVLGAVRAGGRAPPGHHREGGEGPLGRGAADANGSRARPPRGRQSSRSGHRGTVRIPDCILTTGVAGSGPSPGQSPSTIARRVLSRTTNPPPHTVPAGYPIMPSDGTAELSSSPFL